MAIHRKPLKLTVTNYHAVAAARRPGNDDRHFPVCGGENRIPLTSGDVEAKSDPVSLDTVWTTMTAAKEAGHEGQGAEANHDSWQ
jgi:hypothetical protein